MNTRPVEDQLINRAIRDGYGGFPTGLHPALFLYMEVEPALVDVNVHPAKKEVRFRRSADVVNTIVEAIANTLQKHARQEIHAAAAPEPERTLPPAHSTTAPYGEIPARSTNPGSAFPAAARPAPASSAAQPPLSSSARQSHGPVRPPTLRAIPLKQVPATQGKLDFHRQEDEETARNAHENAAPERDASAGFSYLGTLRQQFALFETPEGLVLMHPKAARERIIFERLRARREAPMPSQQLLDPVVLDLDPRDFAVIRQFAPHFDQAGMAVTPFGQNTIRIESIPVLLELENARAFLLELVDRLTQSEFSRNAKRVAYETFIGEFARKSAWRERISPHRAPAILKDLLACEVPYCTPGGKPTLVNYSVPEIKRKFGLQA